MKYSNCTVVKTLILINVLNQIAASVASTSSNSARANQNPYSSSSSAGTPVFGSTSSSSSDDSDADDNQVLSDIELDDETPDDDDNVDDAGEYDDSEDEQEEESSTSMMQRQTDGESTDADGGSPSSQPLRTLKKLQAMLEETDYATATSASNNASAVASNNTGSSYTSSYNSSANAERQAPLVAQPIEQEERRYPYPQQDTQQTTNSSHPQPQQQNTLQSRQRVERIASPRYDSDDDQSEGNGQLWTSKDRSKYKKQRKLQREREMQNQRQRYLEQQEQHIPSDDDGHGTDMTEDTDDGLGYTLPNLPVYFSDAESTDESDHETANANEKQTIYQSPTGIQPQASTHINRPINDSSSTVTNQNNQPTSQTNPNQSGALQQYDPNFQRRAPQQQGQSPPYHYHNMPYQQPPPSQQGPQPHMPQGPHQYPYLPYQQPSQSQQRPQQQMPQGPQEPQQQIPQGQYPYQQPNYIYNNPNPYGPMNPQQQYMQQMQQQQQYQSWATNQPGYSTPYPPQHYYQSHNQSPIQTQPQMQGATSNPRPGFIPQSYIPSPPQHSDNSQMRPMDQSNTFQQMNGPNDLPPTTVQTSTALPILSKAVTLAEAGALITFDAMQKIIFFSMGTCILSYCAVSPRTLEMAEYNAQFKKIVRRVMLTFIVPLITFFLLVLEVKENDLNSLVSMCTAIFSKNNPLLEFVCSLITFVLVA